MFNPCYNILEGSWREHLGGGGPAEVFANNSWWHVKQRSYSAKLFAFGRGGGCRTFKIFNSCQNMGGMEQTLGGR